MPLSTFTRRLRLPLALMLCALSASALSEKQIVEIYVDDNYEPYSYVHKGRAVGLYINVLQAAFDDLSDFDVRMIPVPWQRGKLIMEKGEGLGLAPAFFHGHDWPYLYPYSLHFFEEKIITVCHADILNTPRLNWPEDFIGLHVQNVVGFDGWGGEHFRELVAAGKILYSEARGVDNNILMLGLKRVDCILAEAFSFETTLERLKLTGAYHEGSRHAQLKVGPVVGLDPVYIGYSQPALEQGKYPFFPKFSKDFDIALYKVKKSGRAARLMRQALPLPTPRSTETP